VFAVEMLPAERGDALWLSYGPSPAELHHVIIDGGPRESADVVVPMLKQRIADRGRVELLVISHIDADHIQGVVELLDDPAVIPKLGDIWFNGYEHLKSDALGAVDGERLTQILSSHSTRWNRAFGGHAVVVPDEELPVISLGGGLELTLLSPTPAGLARLEPVWEKECRRAGLVPGAGIELDSPGPDDLLGGWDIDASARSRYRRDDAPANGSSIAFVASYRDTSVLCAADAHAEVLSAGLTRLGAGPHTFTAVKLPHHGSRANTSPKLVNAIRSPHWLISTNGARFSHPTATALARVVTTQARPTFHLNHVTDHVEYLLENAGRRYRVRCPPRRGGSYAEGLVVTLSDARKEADGT
jgi:hypothetical protein